MLKAQKSGIFYAEFLMKVPPTANDPKIFLRKLATSNTAKLTDSVQDIANALNIISQAVLGKPLL